MNEYQHVSINRIGFDNSAMETATFDESHSRNEDVKTGPKIIHLTDMVEIESSSGNFLLKDKKTNIKKVSQELSPGNNTGINPLAIPYQNAASLFRLFVKNGEYVYARPNDIIMLESCDHLVKVYVAFDDKIKKTIRHNSFKHFLLQLPQDQFMRVGRFCAVNIQRLSGGNCNEQTFEFDFRVSIKLKHAISHCAFNTIGK